MSSLSLLDGLGVLLFLGGWLTHHFVSEYSTHSLNKVMARRRHEWMHRMAGRDARMPDSMTMTGLQNGSAFFASTSLIMIGGALAALRASEEAMHVFSSLPFGIVTSTQVFDIKILGFAGIFAYAFFKFVWAYRLFNYCSILIVASPPPNHVGTPEMERAVTRAALMNIEAGRHFNQGLRALFFSIAYLGWLISPVVLMVATLFCLAVLYRRQFNSKALEAASFGDDDRAA